MTDDATIELPAPAAASIIREPTGSRALSIGRDDQRLTLGDHRIVVTESGRAVLDLAISELRRIQFDIERGRPATLVIVPDRPTNEPRIVVVPTEEFAAMGDILAAIGRRLDDGLPPSS